MADGGSLEVLRRSTCWTWLRGPDDVERLIDDDRLFSLLQVPSLRKELRCPRFRSPALEVSLAPFPQLFDELLIAWFREGRTALPNELASWAACGRFRRN